MSLSKTTWKNMYSLTTYKGKLIDIFFYGLGLVLSTL